MRINKTAVLWVDWNSDPGMDVTPVWDGVVLPVRSKGLQLAGGGGGASGHAGCGGGRGELASALADTPAVALLEEGCPAAAIHAFGTPRLNYCIGLYVGLPCETRRDGNADDAKCCSSCPAGAQHFRSLTSHFGGTALPSCLFPSPVDGAAFNL